MAISWDHGLNPSQMRRPAADTVAKVDLVRAEVIAKALGKQVSDLFGEAADKAKAAPKATAPKAPAALGTRKSKASRAADKITADQAKAETE